MIQNKPELPTEQTLDLLKKRAVEDPYWYATHYEQALERLVNIPCVCGDPTHQPMLLSDSGGTIAARQGSAGLRERDTPFDIPMEVIRELAFEMLALCDLAEAHADDEVPEPKIPTSSPSRRATRARVDMIDIIDIIDRDEHDS